MGDREQLIQEIENLPDDKVTQLLDWVRQLQAENRSSNPIPLDAFIGVLKDSPSFSDDPVIVQRQMRFGVGLKYYSIQI